MCRFHTQDFIQIPKEKKKRKSNDEFFCAFDSYTANFTFIGFGNFGVRLMAFHFVVIFFSPDERYQVHQKKFLLLSVKAMSSFGLGMNLNRNIFTHSPPMINTTLCEPRLLCTKRFKPAV